MVRFLGPLRRPRRSRSFCGTSGVDANLNGGVNDLWKTIA